MIRLYWSWSKKDVEKVLHNRQKKGSIVSQLPLSSYIVLDLTIARAGPTAPDPVAVVQQAIYGGLVIDEGWGGDGLVTKRRDTTFRYL